MTYGECARVGKAAAVLLALCTPAAAEEIQILALGDSLIQGYGLVEEEGFVPQMRGWLAEQGHDVQLVNGGVSGDTTAGGLARVEWSLTPEVDAMIVALGGNDVLRGLPTKMARDNLDGILKVAAARDIPVMLVPMRAPGNYGPEYKADFEAIYPALAQEYGAIETPSFFDILLPEGGNPVQAADMIQADGIHPNGKGVALIVAGIGPYIAQLIDAVE
ncbi:arylesterase [Marinovum sp. KMM 9879]